MAFPRGFEPPTCSLGNCRSILLSYGNAATNIIPPGPLVAQLADRLEAATEKEPFAEEAEGVWLPNL